MKEIIAAIAIIAGTLGVYTILESNPSNPAGITASEADAASNLYRSNNSRTGNYYKLDWSDPQHRVVVKCRNVYGSTWHQYGPWRGPGGTSSTTCYYSGWVWFLYPG